MKKSIILSAFVFLTFANSIKAQIVTSEKKQEVQTEHSPKIKTKKNYIGTAPLGLLMGHYRISYERSYNDKKSFGTIGTAYNNLYKGFKLDFFGRYYFSNIKKAEGISGFYALAQGGVGLFQTNYNLIETLGSTGNVNINSSITRFSGKNSFAYGLGVGIGYKYSGKSLFIDSNIKIQNYHIEKKADFSIINNKGNIEKYTNDTPNFAFKIFGPGAIIAPSITVGYIF